MERGGWFSPFTGSTAGSSASCSAPRGRAATRIISPLCFKERLDTVDPGLGVEDMILAAFAVEPLPPEQIGFPHRRPSPAGGEGRAGADEAASDVAPLLDRLGNRLGLAALSRLEAAREPHPGARLGQGAGMPACPLPNPARLRGREGWRPSSLALLRLQGREGRGQAGRARDPGSGNVDPVIG